MNIKIKSKLLTIVVFFVYLTTLGQTRILDISTYSSPSGSDWCWAGCTKMVTEYYGNNTLECEIVEWARQNIAWPNRGDDNCCTYPDSCYGGLWIYDLPDVLDSENLNSPDNIDVVLSLNSVKTAINDNRPILIVGKSSTGGSHLFVVIGYNDSDLNYNDPAGGNYTTSYTDATTKYCMGLWGHRKWEDNSIPITNQPCPIELDLNQEIDADANIIARNNIDISCTIGNNRSIILTAGEKITVSSGFEIPVGSTLEVKVESNPCQ